MAIPSERYPVVIDLLNQQTLKKSIHDLYEIFGGYRKIDLSPTQPSEAEDLPDLLQIRGHLIETSFEALTAKDLLDYFYLAVDHIGDADDLRHFLPKLLELIAEGDRKRLNPAHLPSLLKSAGATEWPSRERSAIASFARAAAEAGVIPDRVAAKILRIV